MVSPGGSAQTGVAAEPRPAAPRPREFNFSFSAFQLFKLKPLEELFRAKFINLLVEQKIPPRAHFFSILLNSAVDTREPVR